MKKGGLGRIPKSLSWIDDVEPTAVKAVKNNIASQEETETKSTQIGLPVGWTRATFIVDQRLHEKIKALAYWDRLTVKEVINEALAKYLQDKNIKPIPKKI